MKFLNYFLLVISLTLNSCSILSGIDEDGKKMMDFVKRIVEEPDRMQEIIESSEYYDKNYTKLIDSNYWHVFINNIKAYKNKGIQYHYEPETIINRLDGSQIKGKSIDISSGNIQLYPCVNFFFQSVNDKWILISVLMGNNY